MATPDCSRRRHGAEREALRIGEVAPGTRA